MSVLLGQNVLLDDRLRAIAGFIPEGARFADIGCDHGYLGAWLLAEGKVKSAELCDISAPSLKKAERLLRRMGLSDSARFSVGDGVLAMAREADCVAISGMGGQTIIGILSAGREKLADARLILQANNGVRELRAFLSQNHWRISAEKLARAAGRRYAILAAEPGEAAYTPVELLCGPKLIENRDPLFPEYANLWIRVAKKALSGAEAADPARADELRAEIELWREGLEQYNA